MTDNKWTVRVFEYPEFHFGVTRENKDSILEYYPIRGNKWVATRLANYLNKLEEDLERYRLISDIH